MTNQLLEFYKLCKKVENDITSPNYGLIFTSKGQLVSSLRKADGGLIPKANLYYYLRKYEKKGYIKLYRLTGSLYSLKFNDEIVKILEKYN